MNHVFHSNLTDFFELKQLRSVDIFIDYFIIPEIYAFMFLYIFNSDGNSVMTYTEKFRFLYFKNTSSSLLTPSSSLLTPSSSLLTPPVRC
jgi:hypothetical protein